MEMAFWETTEILIYDAVKNPGIYNYHCLFVGIRA